MKGLFHHNHWSKLRQKELTIHRVKPIWEIIMNAKSFIVPHPCTNVCMYMYKHILFLTVYVSEF